ncbi:hypothetical protein I4U23_020311 [Adineta vaga]|nr:hypothetical protein I4U23_020311 [Adineta vaga]
MQTNVFDSIITADTVPNDLKNCSLVTDQMECSIRVTWTQNPNQTSIILLAGSERQAVSGRHNLENTITLTNNGTKTQWENSIFYICSSEQCNSLTMLKRLLRSLTSEDKFHTLSDLLDLNTQFQGSFCNFFANSSISCETEMDPNTCKQCATQEYIQSKSIEVCSNCVMDNVIENFITRQVKFFIDKQERHDLWMIECQKKDCNAIETGDLIREKSNIDFNFNYFLNSSKKLDNILLITLLP